MTGKYPIRTGMQGRPLRCGEPRGLPLEETTLPQRLRDLGYITRLVGKWHLGCQRSEYTPTRRGFDSHFGYWNGYIDYFDYMIDQDDFLGYDLRRDMNVSWAEKGKYATDVFTREAVRLILQHNTSRPLFLEVSHLAVHSARNTQLLEVPNLEEALTKFSYIPDTQRRIFSEMTSKLDDSVGQIVSALSDKGILNNTIIVFLTDNGAPTIGELQNWGSNWPLRGMKFTLYEGGVRGVAVVWSSLLQNPGRLSTQMMHISDWYPTIYSMAGGEVDKLGEIDGVDQWPSLMGNNGDIPRNETLLNIGDLDDMEGIINGNFKLVRSTSSHGVYDGFYGEDGRGLPNPPYDSARVINSTVSKAIMALNINTTTSTMEQLIGKIEEMRTVAMVSCEGSQRLYIGGPYCWNYCLFDLEKDPCETVNLASKHPGVVENLKNRLERFKAEMVPELTTSVDRASNPALFNNTWVCWLDDENVNNIPKTDTTTKTNSTVSGSSAKMSLPVYVSILCIVLICLCDRSMNSFNRT
ncbi:arylsulfatase J-like isoform X2 [Zootermopsis nevadensis]|nr:arylsulfatase J-like isoform X2 [Zootermopsis nevadensis]